MVKNPPANEGDTKDSSSNSVGKIPWRTKGQPTPVFLTGKSLGQRTLEGYSPWGHRELDTTEQLSVQIQIPLAISAKEGMGHRPVGWT